MFANDTNEKLQPFEDGTRELSELLENIMTPEFPENPLELIGYNNFSPVQDEQRDQLGTPVQEFYRDATILLTGATGFLGKAVTEKVLRSLPYIKHLYLLIRAKNGKTTEQRISDIFQGVFFRRLRHEVPHYRKKVSLIAGDLCDPGCGISDDDRNKLIEEVNIVFHGAATIRFDETLQNAFKINIMGTVQIIQLCKEMKRLKAFLYVSTAYSNCYLRKVEEKVYPIPPKFEYWIEKIQNVGNGKNLNDTPPEITTLWPNTYVFSKAVTENICYLEAPYLPIGIIRPSIVVSSYREPLKGWIDTVFGPSGLMLGVGCGILHVVLLKLNFVVDLVPVDIVVNTLICSAVNVAQNSTKSIVGASENIPVFNCTTGSNSPLTWIKFVNTSKTYIKQWASCKSMWCFSTIFTSNKYLFVFLKFFLHTVFGYIIDFFLILFGQKIRLSEIYSKINKMEDKLLYFINYEWTFQTDNTVKLWEELSAEDKDLFYFNLKNISWTKHIATMSLGFRLFLLHDGIRTIPAARRNQNIFEVAHYTLKCLFYGLILYVIGKILI